MLALVAAATWWGAATVQAPAQVPKTVDTRLAAPSQRAMLVFTRPRKRQASEVPFRIVDRAGKCLAVLKNGTMAIAPVWPGRQMLMVITGSAPPTIQLLEAKLSTGKTYVVSLRARVSAQNPVDIQVVRRAEQPLEAFPPEVRDALPIEADLRRCTEWVRWKRGRIESRAEHAKFLWDEADDARRDPHTIRRNDGWLASEIVAP